jgi:hypothetical protein
MKTLGPSVAELDRRRPHGRVDGQRVDALIDLRRLFSA